MFIAGRQGTWVELFATPTRAVADYVPMSPERKRGFTMLHLNAQALRERQWPGASAVKPVPFS